MSAAIDALKQAFRDFTSDGIPASGANEPDKQEIRDALDQLNLDLAGVSSGILRYRTKALLDADTSQDDGTLAYVFENNGAPDDAANGMYQWDDSGNAWDPATWYFSAVAAVAEPLIDSATAVARKFLIETEEDSFAITDQDGQRLITFDADGRAMLDPSARLLDLISSSVGADVAPASYDYLLAPVDLLHFYGQSLSLGAGTEQLLSGTSAYSNVLMPDQGVQDATWSGGNLTGIASLATSLEPLDATVRSQSIEAPVVGAVNQLAWRLRSADLIAANAGRGGFGIEGLKKGYNGGNGPYALLVDQFTTYEALTDKPLRSVLCWMQGESDANTSLDAASYKTDLSGIVADYAADTGQADVHLFTYQLSSHTYRSPGYNYNIGLALAEMGEESDDVSVVTPMYFFDYQPAPDGVHLLSASSRLCGAYFGKAIDHYYRTGEKWEPTRPTAVSRVAKIITATFYVPVGNLIYDNTTVTDPGDMGFEVFLQSSGVKQDIASVYIFRNTAVIELVSTPSGPVDLGYALGSELNGQPAGRTTGARGCLRDEDTTRAYYDPGIRLHNWCVMFRKGEGYGA